jgi:hypothetical protein
VKHQASSRFWKLHDELPAEVRELARNTFELLKRDPRHPSLRLKRVGAFWSVRIGASFRALARDSEGVLVWFWIGRHDEYERIVGRSS